jgi:hypothetical protein
VTLSDPASKGIGIVTICEPETAAVGLQRRHHSWRENDTNREFGACGYGISTRARWPTGLFPKRPTRVKCRIIARDLSANLYSDCQTANTVGYPAGLEPTSLVRVDIQFHRKAQSAQSNSRATRLSWAAAHRVKALPNGYVLASIAGESRDGNLSGLALS